MAGYPGRKYETHWISAQRGCMWWSPGDMLLRNWWRMPTWFQRFVEVKQLGSSSYSMMQEENERPESLLSAVFMLLEIR